jgi:hypothetical protein
MKQFNSLGNNLAVYFCHLLIFTLFSKKKKKLKSNGGGKGREGGCGCLATTILAKIVLMQISTIKRPKVMRENKISGPIINNK